VCIKPHVHIKYPWKLTIGDHVWIGEQVWIDNLADVKIGNQVCVSQGAYLLTGNHDFKKETFDLIIGAIVLEDGVWIGAKSVVCPGITCRSHAILTVGSVANRDLDAFGIYRGNPAEKIRVRVMEG
jgi:putative colanic acid biosynthesis acetyltransferase WcaF